MGRKRKKERRQASFTVNLLNHEIETFQNHLKVNETNVWMYAYKYLEECNDFGVPELFELEGYTFFFGEDDEIQRFRLDKKAYPRFKAFIQWAMANCPSGAGWNSPPGRRAIGADHKYVRFPDGRWATWARHVGWVTIDLSAGGWQTKPQKQTYDGNDIWTSNYLILPPGTPEIKRLLEIEEEFPIAHRAALRSYREMLKEAGELRAIAERIQNESDVKWTETRMVVGEKVTDLIKDLATLNTQIQNDTISSKQLSAVIAHFQPLKDVINVRVRKHGKRLDD